jgi:hypothetical protein
MATPQQNEAIGKFELVQLERKMKLLKEAHGTRHWFNSSNVLRFLGVPIMMLIWKYFFSNSYEMGILLCLLPTVSLIGLEAGRANARLDALIKLIGEQNLLDEKNKN